MTTLEFADARLNLDVVDSEELARLLAGGTGGEVVLRATPGRSHAVIRVTDTGQGIPDTHLEQIFEPFVQVGRTPSSAHEGTGLGLSISRDLARAMHGDITVVSRVGEGSAFTLTLPLS